MTINVPSQVLTESLHLLKAEGQRGKESIVLWLGRASSGVCSITQVYRPEHTASHDRFDISRKAMENLMANLARDGLRTLAQVHTHPFEAFHSDADDRWAIVRHIGALSLVLPYFARETTAETFLSHSATFEFDYTATWRKVDTGKVLKWIP